MTDGLPRLKNNKGKRMLIRNLRKESKNDNKRLMKLRIGRRRIKRKRRRRRRRKRKKRASCCKKRSNSKKMRLICFERHSFHQYFFFS
jgi:hypothetical protein